MSDLIEEIKKNLIAGRVDSEDEGFDEDMTGQPGVTELVKQALEEKIPASDILAQALTPGMEKVGRLFEDGEYLLPDMLASAECVAEATEIMEPHLAGVDIQSRGKFIVATVEGDLHDIGKNIVATILQGSGFEVQDIGTSVKASQIVQAVKESKPRFLGLSALLTSTMTHMGEVIDLLKNEGIRDQIIICIGGAPVSEEFAKKIGADIYGEDAFDAMNKLEKLA
ncbi:MAG: corrinoid protein [Acidobacteria bacterium]|nr:corrinoid protein [Acidobacteriota bacterium]MCG2816524.1 corrinoid protein [Candidatus Aminicenantes bacterium]MBU2439205.1 corrinoid protein [Acidobacteriota bacterium]MBU4255575.1 corrinoid protein [Acidobacteriota bacterium]MBU4330008.1 corrinoid protein [Acidobacteriota bacterium]